MIVQPKVRGFICTTAHPVGCAQHVQEQIEYVKKQKPVVNGPQKVLVVGSSTGYGLASRIVAAFGGSNAATIGVFFEKESDGKRTATAGWYNSAAFLKKAQAAGLYAKNINGDAFSDEIKREAIEAIKKDLGSIDLLVYSLASPRRQHPKTGELMKSSLRPIGASYTEKSIDVSENRLEMVTLPPATEDEIHQTVGVMGGEDFEMWIAALRDAGVLAPGVTCVAYSYVGPQVTRAVYRNGTIGRAKDHLEETTRRMDAWLKKEMSGRAFVSVNKALVTQSSSAIPFIPLYFVVLSKIMQEKGVEENCIMQMYRLFAERLYRVGDVPVDENGFIRMDDWEMREDVQQEVARRWKLLSEETIGQLADVEGYHNDFLRLFGFNVRGVDYNADVDVM